MERTRRWQSLPRLVLAVILAGALVVGGRVGYQRWTSPSTTGAVATWFAGYLDVTASSPSDLQTLTADQPHGVIFSFIVSAPGSGCTPMWDATLTLNQASSRLDLDRKIVRLEQHGGGVAVSFGGALNDELATTCLDVGKLAHAYGEVIDRYHSSTIDLDLEAANLSDRTAGHRRAQAVKKLQLDRRAHGEPLAVWLTLPVSPSGLTQDGQAAVGEMLGTGVDLAGVDVMTMDYGGGLREGQSMLEATTNALTATQRQLKALYGSAGTNLSDAAPWSKLGVTPMIGQNDIAGEIFSLSSAKGLNEFVHDHGIGRVSMWSLNRDKTCGPYVNVKYPSDGCSGVGQGNQTFADLLAAGLTGRVSFAAKK